MEGKLAVEKDYLSRKDLYQNKWIKKAGETGTTQVHQKKNGHENGGGDVLLCFV